MELDEFFDIIEYLLGHPIDDEQRNVINHTAGPLWVVAGPGSGKTEVLVVRTLKLIFVDNVNPKSILITTFTEKAAKNLFDRISDYANEIFNRYPDLRQQIDIHGLRIGTLHSLCSDIMLEYRYPNYENYRLLDDIEQYLFIYEHTSLVRDSSDRFLPLWQNFHYLVEGYDPIFGTSGWSNRNYPPTRWKRARAAVSLFNRIVEDLIELDTMRNNQEPWQLLTEAYEEYQQNLENHRRCDFAHLQQKFLHFLNTDLGEWFLEGDGSNRHPGINYVMVDEYQDTNPIQERIYFELTKYTHNLCVVGDDDQALYRFRGGTVDCMVTFDQACNREWSNPSQVTLRFLNANYRSHSEIVRYYDSYIQSIDEMNLPGARVAGKPSLDPRSGISGAYPAVAYMRGQNLPEVATNFAEFVRGLLDNGIIEDASQCVLLMKSVRETSYWALHFANALRERDIQPYNPRSRTFLSQQEVRAALGAFVSIVDPNLAALETIGRRNSRNTIRETVRGWVNEYQRLASTDLANYVNESVNQISSLGTNNYLNATVQSIFYRILSHEPFLSWLDDPEMSYRLGKLTNLFDRYSSTPYLNRVGSTRGDLKTSSTNPGEISFNWRRTFYYSFVGLLASEGLNDPEDEEIITPPNRLPIMTIHQAKGLEFPFVFVYRLSLNEQVSSTILLEDALSQFRTVPRQTNFTPEQRQVQDLVRFFYVAYSRPEYALIHLGSDSQLTGSGTGFINRIANSFKNRLTRLR